VRPDPSIAARLLALPVEVRRRLLVPGPGYLIEYGAWVLRNHPPSGLLRSESWYPADSAAWMRATGCPDWSIDCDSGEVVAVLINHSDPMKDWHRGTTAEECALSWFEAGLG